MTGKKFKKLVNEIVDDNDIIIISKDAEGNSFSPFSDFSYNIFYKAITSWYGEIGYKELTPELIKDGYGEGDLIKNGKKAVVLWPTN